MVLTAGDAGADCDRVVTGAIVGMRSAAQTKQILRLAEFRLSPDEILEIEEYLKANPVRDGTMVPFPRSKGNSG